MKSCPFCDILEKKTEQYYTILYEDDLVYVIPDIRPHAYVHYLVIPKCHIYDIHKLSTEDIGLLSHMIEVGHSITPKTDEVTKVKYGFHIRPFHSVNHLHLHCLVLPYNSWFDKIIFHAPFFLKAEKALQKLQKKLEKKSK